ncbi:MAG: hypothetical protein AB1489_27520 [Acidobacteriota bacterium]
MTKKLSHLILASILAVAMLVPLFPQQAQAQSARQELLSRFQQRVLIFNRVLLRADNVLTTPRVLAILSAALGIPVPILEAELEASALPINIFVLAQLMARTAGVPVVRIIDLINLNRNFGQIALQFSLLDQPFTFRMDSLIDILLAQTASALGGEEIPNDTVINEFFLAVRALKAQFDNLATTIGDPITFQTVVFRGLAIETGLSVGTITNLRSLLPPDLQVGDFVVFLLAFNSLNLPIFAPDGGRIELVSDDVIISFFLDGGLPLPIFTNRIIYFQRRVISMTDGSSA